MKVCKMELRMVALAVALALVISPAVLAGSQKVTQGKRPLAELKLKVFEGVREGRVEAVKTVTSSFLRYTLSASIKSEDTSEREENQLRRVFNLRSVQLLTEANLSWPEIRSKDFHMFRLDSKEYAIVMTLVRVNSQERITCRLEVMEQDRDRKSNLLDSELALDGNVITTFGFEDSSGKPYFLSLKVQKIWTAGGPVLEPVEGVVGGVVGGVVVPPPTGPVPPEKAAEAAKGLAALEAIRATGEIKPPRLIKKVDPVYPEEAREAGVEGVVILEVTTDKLGKVAAVRVLRSVPLLDQAAIDAVKQWVYEPYVVDGEARPIVFTVTVAFKLR